MRLPGPTHLVAGFQDRADAIPAGEWVLRSPPLRCRYPRSGVSKLADLAVPSRALSILSSPVLFCMYDGPEFTSRHFLVWCEERGIRLIHIQSGPVDAVRTLRKLSKDGGVPSRRVAASAEAELQRAYSRQGFADASNRRDLELTRSKMKTRSHCEFSRGLLEH